MPDYNHYIDNDQFERLIYEYQSTKDKSVLEIITRDYFYVLAYNIVAMSRFKHIEDEDALQEAVIICLKRLDSFDQDRGKAFNFFTTLIMNQLKGMYKKGKMFASFKWQYLYDYACQHADVPFWRSVKDNMDDQKASMSRLDEQLSEQP